MRETSQFGVARVFVRLIQAILIVLVLGAPSLAEPTLRDINKMNGFDESVEGIKSTFASSLDRFPGSLPEELAEAWEIASDGAFDPQRMISAMEENAGSKIDQEQLSTLHAFFDTPLGRKISALEIAATKQPSPEEKQAEGQAILAILPERDPERLALYRRMVDGLGAIDIGESIAMNVVYALIAAVVGASGTTMSDEDLRGTVLKSMGPVRETVGKSVYSGMAWTYRDVPIGELRRYAEFLETPAAARYYDVMMSAFGAVLTAEARTFGNRLFVSLGLRKA